MVRQIVEFEVHSISQDNASTLKTKDVVQISLQPQGRLQIQVGKLSHVMNCFAMPKVVKYTVWDREEKIRTELCCCRIKVELCLV
jgi:hypothetical protein